jgi:hypothetical protein
MLSGIEEQRLPWQEASILESDRPQATFSSFQARDRFLANLDASPVEVRRLGQPYERPAHSTKQAFVSRESPDGATA